MIEPLAPIRPREIGAKWGRPDMLGVMPEMTGHRDLRRRLIPERRLMHEEVVAVGHRSISNADHSLPVQRTHSSTRALQRGGLHRAVATMDHSTRSPGSPIA